MSPGLRRRNPGFVLRGLAILVAGCQLLAAQSESRSVSWGKLGAAVADRDVTVVLAGGVRLQGTVESVLADALAMNVRKSSDRRVYPAGQSSIARKDIAEVRIKRVRGPFRAIFAAGAGGAGALASLPWAISEERVNVSDSSRLASWMALSAGFSVAGYLLGRAIDTGETVVTIAP